MKSLFAVLVTVVALALVATGGAGLGKLKCFAGDPATCSVSQDTATLDTSDGGFAGAYYTASKANGTPLTGVDYAFQYNCDPSDDTVACVGRGVAALEHSDRHARCRQDERLCIHRRGELWLDRNGQHGERHVRRQLRQR